MNNIQKILADERIRLEEMCRLYETDTNRIDDIIQETYLVLLEMNQDMLNKIYNTDGINGLMKYCHIIIRRFCCYTKNKFYYKYNKYYERVSTTQDLSKITYRETDSTVTEKMLTELDNAVEGLYWYDREVLKLYYYEGHTLDSLAKKTGISRNSLFNTIDKVRKELKEVLSNE